MPHLLKDFYTVTQQRVVDQKVEAEITLNRKHEIYQGHFPQVPIVPGVCQMQMIREILSDVLEKDLTFVTADNMKFMAVINPEISKYLSLKIEYKYTEHNQIRVNGSIFRDAQTFFKFSGNFK